MLQSAGELSAKRLSLCGDDPDRSRLIANFAALATSPRTSGSGSISNSMAWHKVETFADEVCVVEPRLAERRQARRRLASGTHWRGPADVLTAPAGLIRSAQLCDAFAKGDRYFIHVAQSPQVANMPMAAAAITAVASQPRASTASARTGPSPRGATPSA